MDIKNTTHFSKEGFFTLNKVMRGKSYGVLIFFELVLGILLAIMIKNKMDLYFIILLGIFMVTYPIIFHLILNGQMKRHYKLNEKVYLSMIYTYQFTDDRFYIHVDNNGRQSDSKNSYQVIFRVIETEKFLFIFITTNQAWMVEKENFESPNDVQQIVEKIKNENIKYKYMKVK